MKHALGCWLVLFVAVTAAEDVRQAIAVLSSEDGVVKGVIHFSQQGSGSPVIVTGNVTGLTGTDHGFHVHEKGDITNKCKGAGGHFNPEKKAHGAPNVTDRHVGDLGNILNEGGTAIVNINDSVISLYSSTHGIIGRAVVVHELQDDLGKGGKHDSNTTGAAGSRIACGVIGIQSPVTPWNNGASMPQSITAACLSLVVVHLLKNLVM